MTTKNVLLEWESIEALKRALIGVKDKREESFILLNGIPEDWLPEIVLRSLLPELIWQLKRFQIREESVPYNVIFEPKKVDMGPQNTYFWNINYE